MKTRIVMGAAMLLSLGSAVAGGMIYVKDKSGSAVSQLNVSPVAVEALELTPETIAKWKATAATADYSPPMLPI